ncbi:unnamed protein product, partial [Rotaria sp. Silwood2]
QSKIASYASNSPQSAKLKECERNKIKNLLVEWVCTDIRPFSIINDNGLHSLVQECSRYGNISVDHVLYSAHSTSLHVAKLADEYRLKIRQELIEPLDNQAVTVCPDLWTDPYRQISYLGISVCFTNSQYQFFTYDLCCSPFVENNKTASSIIAAIKKALEPFGITDLTKLNFVSDRGANLVKALKPYSTMNCVAHRFNNVVKASFYQTVRKKRTNNKTVPCQSQRLELTSSSDSESDIEVDEGQYVNNGDEQENKGVGGDKVSGDKNGCDKGVRCATSSCIIDYSTIKLSDIPSAALNILNMIRSCKSLNGLNKSIQDQGGLALVQSTVIRWLSFISLLESIKKSYKQVKKVLYEKKKTFSLDKMIISQLICLLKPFKHVLVIVQQGKTPSLHLVTIAVLTLRQALQTHTSLIEYSKKYGINSSSTTEDVSENEEECLEEAEVRECHLYIRQRMAQIKAMEKNQSKSDGPEKHSLIVDNEILAEPAKKKPKRFGEDFETGNLSDEFDNESDDELNKYLEQRIDIESIDDNPLAFWYEHRFIYPILSRLARSIYSIPATTANVERQFSATGMMITSRRTKLNPEQINNAMFLRSVNKSK